MQQRGSEQRAGQQWTARSAEAGAPPAPVRTPPTAPLSASGGNSARGPGAAAPGAAATIEIERAKRAKIAAAAAEARSRAASFSQRVADAIDLTGNPNATGVSDGAGGAGFFGASGPPLGHQPSAGVEQRRRAAERGDAVVRGGSGKARAEISTQVDTMRANGFDLPRGYAIDGNHDVRDVQPPSDPRVDMEACAAEMEMENLVEILTKERVTAEHRATAERALFMKLGEMDNIVANDPTDIVLRTLHSIRHLLKHAGLKRLVNAHMSEVATVGTPTRHPAPVSLSAKNARARSPTRRLFLTSILFEARSSVAERTTRGRLTRTRVAGRESRRWMTTPPSNSKAASSFSARRLAARIPFPSNRNPSLRRPASTTCSTRNRDWHYFSTTARRRR